MPDPRPTSTESGPSPAPTEPGWAGSYQPTPRTTPTRKADRVGYDRERVHAVLDAHFLCHVAFCVDGEPRVLPTLYGRDGDRLYLHGSSGGRMALSARDEGVPVSLCVSHVDALVLARAAVHHSVDYRSVVVHGRARAVTDEAAKRHAFDVLLDHVVPGRSADCRPATPRELAATGVLELDLVEVSVKVRDHGVVEDEADLGLAHWAGTVPMALAAGAPRPVPELVGVGLPAYLERWWAGWDHGEQGALGRS